MQGEDGVEGLGVEGEGGVLGGKRVRAGGGMGVIIPPGSRDETRMRGMTVEW